MEEFKYLEGIINLCTEELYNGDRNIHATLGFEELKELQNLLNKRKALEIHAGILINKNKELLEKVNYLEEIRANQTYENEELEKMVELMAENIYNTSDTLNMLDIGKEINYDLEKLFNGIDDTEALKIIIDYFRKKAKGE